MEFMKFYHKMTNKNQKLKYWMKYKNYNKKEKKEGQNKMNIN